jgi:hypothetical protein
MLPALDVRDNDLLLFLDLAVEVILGAHVFLVPNLDPRMIASLDVVLL